MTLPDLDRDLDRDLDHETATDDDAPTWSDLDAPTPRVRLPVAGRKRTYPRRVGPRAETILRPGRVSRRTADLWAMESSADGHGDYERPRTRADCLPGGCNEARPCPWVSCSHHLAIDVTAETGAIKSNFPATEVWELRETCALDVADRGGLTLGEVGDVINLTRERVRQLENRGLTELRRLGEKLRDFVDYELPDSEGDDHDLRATPARDTVRDAGDTSALATLPTGVWSQGEERS